MDVAPDTDVAAIIEGAVTVTPLHNDLTFHAMLADAATVIGDVGELLNGAIH